MEAYGYPYGYGYDSYAYDDVASSESLSPVDGTISGPKFDALRNAIYHVARRNYFDLLNRMLNFSVIILGASVAGKAAKLLHVEESLLEFAVLIVATAQLTFDFGYRARGRAAIRLRHRGKLRPHSASRSGARGN